MSTNLKLRAHFAAQPEVSMDSIARKTQRHNHPRIFLPVDGSPFAVCGTTVLYDNRKRYIIGVKIRITAIRRKSLTLEVLMSIFNQRSIKQKRFRRDPNKRYLTKVRFYPACMYFALDRWLKNMSCNGWHIVDCGIFTYLFEEGSPQEKEYFTYMGGGTGRNDGGFFSLSLRYPFLEKTYGVKKKNSQINANERKAHQIVEIDVRKIDVHNDIGFCELRHDRNRLHALETARDIGILALCALLLYSVAT